MNAVETTIDVAVRRARADAARSCSPIIAALAAGAGAELVARAQLAREVLEVRAERWAGLAPEKRSIELKHRAAGAIAARRS